MHELPTELCLLVNVFKCIYVCNTSIVVAYQMAVCQTNSLDKNVGKWKSLKRGNQSTEKEIYRSEKKAA